MPIKVACSCGQAFAAPDHLAGRAVKCPKCSQPLNIPAAQPQQPAAPAGGLADLLAEEGLAMKAGSGPQCPSCSAPMPPHGFICVQCGYNVQLGRRVQISDPHADAASAGARELVEKASREVAVAPREQSKAEVMIWAFVMTFFMLPLLIVCGVAVIVWGKPVQDASNAIFAVLESGNPDAYKYVVPFAMVMFGSAIIFAGWLGLQLLALDKSRINGIICLIYSAGFGLVAFRLLTLIFAKMIEKTGEQVKLASNWSLEGRLLLLVVFFLISQFVLGAYPIVVGVIYWRSCLTRLVIFCFGLLATITGYIVLFFFAM